MKPLYKLKRRTWYNLVGSWFDNLRQRTACCRLQWFWLPAISIGHGLGGSDVPYHNAQSKCVSLLVGQVWQVTRSIWSKDQLATCLNSRAGGAVLRGPVELVLSLFTCSFFSPFMFWFSQWSASLPWVFLLLYSFFLMDIKVTLLTSFHCCLWQRTR